MKKYQQIELKESQLEDLVRIGADLIEDGMKYVDHQKITDKGRMDVLMVDSGKAIVVAELKINEDDNMLFQGLDYYDYVSTNIEAFARIYKEFGIDPMTSIRLMLIAPSFSQALINRCKWIDANISLFMFKCIKCMGSEEIVPVFSEISIPALPAPIEEKYTIQDRVQYIKSSDVRNILGSLIADLPNWKKDKILIEPIKYSISVRVSGKVFMYLSPRRDKFLVETYNPEGKWVNYSVNSSEDLNELIGIMKENMEKKSK
ncbi:MAG TPA: hypothetical protein DCE80_16110 [Ignavibacteriales bacterium]|nr:hypothetical protein [Ignavibacteriales bacterium]